MIDRTASASLVGIVLVPAPFAGMAWPVRSPIAQRTGALEVTRSSSVWNADSEIWVPLTVAADGVTLHAEQMAMIVTNKTGTDRRLTTGACYR